MNKSILITSIGRSKYLVDLFKNQNEYKIITADCNKYATGLYNSDCSYLVPRISSNKYLNEVLRICKKENVKAIIPLLDREILFLSKKRNILSKNNIELISSNQEGVKTCFNKFKFFNILKENSISTPITYNNLNDFKIGLKKNEICFPVIIKPVTGKASKGVMKITNLKELELMYKNNYIIQEFIEGTELGVDVYVDLINNKVTSIFIKEKLEMRAGETDKAISIYDDEIVKIINKLIGVLNLKGPLDIDVFKTNDHYYISEINPRFGGGYYLAYSSGVNFIKSIINNLNNKENIIDLNSYKPEVVMMKYTDAVFKDYRDLNNNKGF